MAEATCSLKELIRRILSGLSIDRAPTAKEQKKKKAPIFWTQRLRRLLRVSARGGLTWYLVLDQGHPPLCFDERNRGLGEYRGVIHDTKMPRTVSRYPICRCRGRGVGTRTDFCSTGAPLWGQNDWNASGTRPKYWSAFSMKNKQKTE